MRKPPRPRPGLPGYLPKIMIENLLLRMVGDVKETDQPKLDNATKRRHAQDRADDAEIERIRLGDGYDLMENDYMAGDY